MTSVVTVRGGGWSGRIHGRALDRTPEGAYVCHLAGAVAVFNLAGEIGDLIESLAKGQAASAHGLLVAGMPTTVPERLERLLEALERRGVPVHLTGLLAAQTAGRAVVDAAVQRRTGTPVYLRYAAEWPAERASRWHTAEAIWLAAEALGPPSEVYALSGATSDTLAGSGRTPGSPAQGSALSDALERRTLSVMLHHPDGATSLLGLGMRAAAEHGDDRNVAPATLLLLGNQGAVEAVPPPAHGLAAVPNDSVSTGAAATADAAMLLRSGLDTGVAMEMAGWLEATLPLLDDAAACARSLRGARRAVAALAAVHAAAVTGQPRPVRWEP